MRILMIETSGWGGISHYTYNLLQALSKKNSLKTVLITDKDYELDNFVRNFEIIKVSIRKQSYLKAVFKIGCSILKIKPDIVHIQSLLSARKDWIFFILARLLKIKIVFTAHNILPHEEFERNAFGIKFALNMIYRCSKIIIVHSQYCKERLISLFKVSPEKIKLIYHGNYIFARFKEIPQDQARDFLKIPKDKKIILHFGTIREYKGIDVLIHAFRKLREIHSDIMLLIAGKPINTDISFYKNLIEELGLKDAVILKDTYISFNEIPFYFFAADIATFPYKEIDTTGALQLAYAFSKPVVVSSTGGLPEAIEDGSNGILIEPDNIEALRAALEKILFDENLIKNMGDNSFRLAKEKFSWDKIADETRQLYSKLYKNAES